MCHVSCVIWCIIYIFRLRKAKGGMYLLISQAPPVACYLAIGGGTHFKYSSDSKVNV